MSDRKGTVPKDSSNAPFDRAMGFPLVSEKKIGAADYRDIFDLSEHPNRTFIGISIYNPDTANQIYVALGARDCGDAQKRIVVQPNSFLSFDEQSFGYNFIDVVTGLKAARLRAKLSATSGTAATGTIDYLSQPDDGDVITVNGRFYEFSSDGSVAPGRIKVEIGANADATMTNFATAVNSNDSEVTASIDTGANRVTLTSNWGGTDGNSQTFADGGNGGTSTGFTFSGSGNLAGGANGLQPTIHLW